MLFSYSGQTTLKHAGTTSSRKNGKKNTTERHWTAALADLEFSHLSCGHRWRNSDAATWILLASVGTPGALQSSPQKVHLIMRCKPWGIRLSHKWANMSHVITKYTKTDQRIGIELGLWSWNGWHVVVECNATIFHYSWSWWTTLLCLRKHVWNVNSLNMSIPSCEVALPGSNTPLRTWDAQHFATSHYRLRLNKGHGPTLEPYCGT